MEIIKLLQLQPTREPVHAESLEMLNGPWRRHTGQDHTRLCELRVQIGWELAVLHPLHRLVADMFLDELSTRLLPFAVGFLVEGRGYAA